MEHSIVERKQPGVAGVIAFACREPGRAVIWMLGLHLVVWTMLPVLICPNLQIDLAEGLALGKEWQLGYWKHPPLPWWIDDLAYRAVGDVRAVYLLGPLAVVISLYAVWRLGLKVASPQNALIAVLALEGLHFFNFTAVKFNHDVLQLPFYALTGLFVYRAITAERSIDWILSGVWLALAAWTKYTAVALAVPVGLVLLIDPFARRRWRTSGPYLMAAVFLLMFLPHLVWLFENDFLPIQYADVRAISATHWYEWLGFPVRWAASQVFFLLPTVALLAIVLLGARRNPPRDAQGAFAQRYLMVLALGPFVFVTLGLALLGRLGVAMWGYPLWTFMPLAAMACFEPVTEAARLRLFARACIVVLVAMPAAYAAVELLEPFLRDRPKASQFPGKLLAETITREWHETTGMPLAYVGGADFVSSGAGEFAPNTVAVYSPDRPHVVVHGDPALSPWIDPVDLGRRGAVLLWEGPNDIPAGLKANFPRAERRPPLTLPRQTLYPRGPATVSYAIVLPQR
jgi:4-amino-4-deoxy-L-arabinose transferase-like glycosyltransferase